jgi:flagellar secretion chaperone FliS
MTYSFNRSSVYQEISVNTSSPTKLVVMLYEGAIKFLGQAVDGINRKDFAQKSQSVDRAVAIIQHLQGTLDLEKGQEISVELDRLYTYMGSRIFDGSAKLDVAPLQEVIKLLETLLSGWEQIARKEQEHAVPTDLLAQASSGRFELHA